MTGHDFHSPRPGEKVDKVDKGGEAFGWGGLSTFSTLYPQREDAKKDIRELLYGMIASSIRRIDIVGGPWTGWRDSLPINRLCELIRIEHGIDQAYQEGDKRRLAEWLMAYEDFCLFPYGQRSYN